jgi:hypothetical protein
MNNILNKIAQMERNAAELQGVKLAKHEVELASATDLPKLYGNSVSMNKDIYGDTFRKVDALKAVLKKKEDDAIKMIADVDGAMIDFAKKAKELGIDPKTAPLYNDAKKELDDLYKGVKLVQTFLDGLNP